MAETSMIVDELLDKAEASDDVDFLREGVRVLAQALMDAEVAHHAGAGYGQRAPEQRTARRNGYRSRRWDTRVGSIELAIPRLRRGSYFPSFLEARRRAERALCAVVAQAYVEGVSTRKVEDVAAQLGVETLSSSQVSRLCGDLDELVEAWRTRPPDTGPYPFVWIDALAVKVREAGRIVATGVNADGHRETLGPELGSAEAGPPGPSFCAGWSPAACTGCAWSPPMPTRASNRPSPPSSRAPSSSAVAPTSCATCKPRCPGMPSHLRNL